MAEAFLQIVLDRLSSLIQKEVGLLWGVNKEMQKLSSILSTIQAVLGDAEEKQVRDKAIKDWLRKLKAAAYDVCDILDEFATEASQTEYESCKSGPTYKATAFMACLNPNNILFQYKIANTMKEVGERLDRIAEERLRFHLQDAAVERQVQVLEWRQTGSIITEPLIYGRKEDQERIVEYLLKVAFTSKDMSVYPIVGIGGIGKTTLAQLVFNDERVRKHFELTIWVCVSNDFNVRRLIKAITESATGIACETLDLAPLQRRLQEILRGRRYLIVMDDVWNEDQQKWNTLKNVLACGTTGASIIVTTRLKTVASIAGTLPAHHLSNLSEDDCWSLFRAHAFGLETGRECSNLEPIAKEIVKKCGGVAMAAQTLGSLLRFENEVKQWLHIRDSQLWNLQQEMHNDENSILAALRLSYLHLPLHLRQCFAYCAVFPKDYRIKKETLINLWMANGFISSHGQLEPEDVGDDICNKLYWRSLFQDVEKDELGNILNFKMHDLVHDLAQSIMEDECQILEPGRRIISSRRIRHVTIPCYSEQSFITLDAASDFELLRTLYLPRYNADKFFCSFSRLHSLRALVATDSMMKRLSSLIGNLKHLRYLDFSNSAIKTLSDSICGLWNLQILKLENCRNLDRLPNHITLLKNLRHLSINGCSSLSYLPPKLGKLTCLKTLSLFIVERQRGCHLAELQKLDLRGELCITNLERVGNPTEAKEANLSGKENLQHLSLVWENIAHGSELPELAEQVLECLEPHPNLKWLKIKGFRGTDFPNWMNQPIMNNLVSLKLFNCKNCVHFPPLWKLHCLRYLWLDGMQYVRFIDEESHAEQAMIGFPSLETLSIWNCPRLERLSRDERRELLPLLTELTFYNCPKLSSLPFLRSLKKLDIPNFNTTVFNSISNLSGLTSLSIANNNEVIFFPDGMLRKLTSLQKLAIKNFTKLPMLPEDLFAGLNSLEEMRIYGCEELKSLPEQGMQDLTSLRRLSIEHCSKFISLPQGIQHLTSLHQLTISACPELAVLPDAIEHLISLHHLSLFGPTRQEFLPDGLSHIPALQLVWIYNYPNMSLLPDSLGNLTSLQSLHIWECSKLTSLPSSIQNLTNLKELRIGCCPELVRRCDKQAGEDWYKIAHIPQVYLDLQLQI